MWPDVLLISLGYFVLNCQGQVSLPQEIRSSLPQGQFDQSNVICISNLFTNAGLGLFGFSVRLIQNEGREPRSWVFIGDPNGNSTDPTYRSWRSVNEPGVVWRCSLGQSNKEACQIMHLDPDSRNVRSPQVCSSTRCPDFPPDEDRDASWVGGMIESNKNRFITCGHRRRFGPSVDPNLNGICYWFNKNTMYRSWDPSSNDLNIDLTRYNHRLLPLYEDPDTTPRTTSNQLFYLRDQKGSLVDWAFGQAGISIHLTDKNELLIGAPGVRLWTGTIIIYHDADVRDDRVNRGRLNRFQGREFAKFTVAKRENQIPLIPGRHYYEYFGYAVTSGKYQSGRDYQVYVAGAPRARSRGRPMMGQVVMFRLPLRTSSFSEDPIVEITTFSGDQVGSYFGSVLLSADVTSDGFDELFVGAPFYNTDFNSGRAKRDDSDNERTGRAEDYSSFQTYSKSGDQGCVFAYSYGRSASEVTQRVIYGSNSPGARFGSSMISLGDINEDFFNDIAVGAPYENDGEGAVFIFYGQSNLNNWKWSEKIRPQKYEGLLAPGSKFQGFGVSLSGDIDVDGNSTPDLSIGSYLSQQVLILRTRPKIKIEGRIQVIGQHGGPIQTVPVTVTSLRIESCVRFSGLHAGEALSMEITVRVDPRFGIIQPAGERMGSPRVKSYEEQVSRDYKCTIFEANVNKIIEVDESQARVPPIRIEQFVKYGGTDANNNRIYHYKIVKGGNELPTLDYAASGPIDFQQFCPSCPFPTLGETVLDLEIASECDDPSNCKPELTIEAWFAVDGNKIKSMVLDWSKRITLHVTITNSGEPAYNPMLGIKWSESVDSDYKPRIHSKPAECSDELICSLGKSLKAKKPSKALQIDFDLNGLYTSMAAHDLNVELTSYVGSTMQHVSSTTLTLDLKPQFRTILDGVQSEGFGFDNPFSQQYIVSIEGPSVPSTMQLTFKFPTVQIREGLDQEIILVAPPKGNYNCSADPSSGHFSDFVKFIATTDKLQPTFHNDSRDSTISRQRRHTNEVIQKTQNQNGNMTLVFSCDDVGIKCFIVHCLINKPSRRENIVTFEMALHKNSTEHLQETASTILIRSHGLLEVYAGFNSEATAETVLLKSLSKVGHVPEIPLWIYIVGGVGGFIILAIIVAILYWRGFFRRDKKEQLEQLKVQAGIQDHLLAANQRMPSFQGAGNADAFE